MMVAWTGKIAMREIEVDRKQDTYELELTELLFSVIQKLSYTGTLSEPWCMFCWIKSLALALQH